MAKSSVSHGGFHTGSVGGDINFEVRGDFVTRLPNVAWTLPAKSAH